MAKNPTNRILGKMRPHKVVPIATMGNEPLILPNYSGAAHHSRERSEDYNADNLTAKSIDVDHTAIESDDHAIEIDVNAAGFGDVKALDIVFVTGAIGTGNDEEAILINIDQTLATGGDINGIEVLTTEGSAVVHGMEVGAQVGPIDQISGVFSDMDSMFVNGVNEFDALKDGGTGNISFFVADNDTIVIGDLNKFEELEFILNTVASGAGIQPKIEFSIVGDAWQEFSPADGTNAFRNTGVMLWLD